MRNKFPGLWMHSSRLSWRRNLNSGYNGGPAPKAMGGFGGGGGESEDNGAFVGGGGYSGGGSCIYTNQTGGVRGWYCNGQCCPGVTGGNSNDAGLVRPCEDY